MMLSKYQLEAAAYLFESSNGNPLVDFQQEFIEQSGFQDFDVSELEGIIVDGLNEGLYHEDDLRTSAYWALSKRFNTKLIPEFRRWLKMELDLGNSNSLFQVMIALGNLEEPVFSKSRAGYAIHESDQNRTDANRYLQSLGEPQQSD